MMAYAIVKSSELGSCWRPERFCSGECKYLPTCRKNKNKQGKDGPLPDCKAYFRGTKTEVIYGPGLGGVDYQI